MISIPFVPELNWQGHSQDLLHGMSKASLFSSAYEFSHSDNKSTLISVLLYQAFWLLLTCSTMQLEGYSHTSVINAVQRLLDAVASVQESDIRGGMALQAQWFNEQFQDVLFDDHDIYRLAKISDFQQDHFKSSLEEPSTTMTTETELILPPRILHLYGLVFIEIIGFMTILASS
jgi:hypothetical protein